VDDDEQRLVVATELHVGDIIRTRPERHHDIRLRSRTRQHRVVIRHDAIVPQRLASPVQSAVSRHQTQD
jgi:hypothetical protein